MRSSSALWLATPHTNARGFVHGGLIAALTDKAMGHSCGHKMRGAHSLVTVSMSIDFISSAQIGQWLTVETDVIKTGSTICFAQCFVKADGVVIARANGTFRVVPKKAYRARLVPGRGAALFGCSAAGPSG